MNRQEEVYKKLGAMAQGAIRRKRDEKPLAMFDYFNSHFDELRYGWVSPQDFLRGCKTAWDKEGK